MVAMNETNGFDVANGRATLCVHFSASGAEHCISFADAAPAKEISRAAAARLTVIWSRHPGGAFVGRALLRGEVACDAYLLGAGPDAPADFRTPARDRDALRSAGLSRHRAHQLANLPERPLLATISRAAELSPHLLRRIHSLLLTTVAACVEPR